MRIHAKGHARTLERAVGATLIVEECRNVCRQAVVGHRRSTSELLLHWAVYRSRDVVGDAIRLTTAQFVGQLLSAEEKAALLRVSASQFDHLVEEKAIGQLDSQREIVANTAVAVRRLILIVKLPNKTFSGRSLK